MVVFSIHTRMSPFNITDTEIINTNKTFRFTQTSLRLNLKS